jgi:hypothetical protein
LTTIAPDACQIALQIGDRVHHAAIQLAVDDDRGGLSRLD